MAGPRFRKLFFWGDFDPESDISGLTRDIVSCVGGRSLPWEFLAYLKGEAKFQAETFLQAPPPAPSAGQLPVMSLRFCYELGPGPCAPAHAIYLMAGCMSNREYSQRRRLE